MSADYSTSDFDPQVTDGAEVGPDTGPRDASDDDGDLDGLDYLDEVANGTDAANADSDAGGVEDGVEVSRAGNPHYDAAPQYRPNPLDAFVGDTDSDGDGLTDAHEIDLGTLPLVRDTDEGGVSDSAELDTHAWTGLSDPQATNPLDFNDDFEPGVNEIGNCGVKLLNSAGEISQEARDYNNYNSKPSQAWFGFAPNQRHASPNNDGHVGGETWTGRRGSGSAPIATLRFTVDGVDGCYGSHPAGNAEGHTAVNAKNFGSSIEGNCILLIPVFSDGEGGSGVAPSCPMAPTSSQSPCEFFVMKVLAFKVSFEARLLDDYPTFGGSYPGWSQDSGGTVVIKLKDNPYSVCGVTQRALLGPECFGSTDPVVGEGPAPSHGSAPWSCDAGAMVHPSSSVEAPPREGRAPSPTTFAASSDESVADAVRFDEERPVSPRPRLRRCPPGGRARGRTRP